MSGQPDSAAATTPMEKRKDPSPFLTPTPRRPTPDQAAPSSPPSCPRPAADLMLHDHELMSIMRPLSSLEERPSLRRHSGGHGSSLSSGKQVRVLDSKNRPPLLADWEGPQQHRHTGTYKHSSPTRQHPRLSTHIVHRSSADTSAATDLLRSVVRERERLMIRQSRSRRGAIGDKRSAGAQEMPSSEVVRFPRSPVFQRADPYASSSSQDKDKYRYSNDESGRFPPRPQYDSPRGRDFPDHILPRAKELPLSAGKTAAAVAVLLVDKAFDYMGSGTDDVRRQTLLQKLHISETIFEDTGRRLLITSSWVTSNIIWMFRDAVEEMEDAINEIDYHRLEERAHGSISMFIMNKIVNKLARNFIPNNYLGSLRKAVRLLDVTTSLLNYSYQCFLSERELSNVPSSASQGERYPNWITTGTIFGRDREKELIVQWLTKDTAKDNPISVCAVVGMAGMGKTTLANIVREDPRVSIDFDHVVWVQVSFEFNVVAMTRVILGSVTGMPRYYTTTSIEVLQNSLADELRYKKLLLILDDVWEDNSVDKWEALLTPLRACKIGSRILLTTRMQSVVDAAAVATRSAAECLKMDELDEDNNLRLLKSQLPFHVADSENYRDLLFIGEQIEKKIGGCPFVTSILARWLGSHIEINHWTAAMQKGWQYIEEKDIIIASFRLSYDYLPTELQACFRYCSLFPKGYKFNKFELANMWICSGLIPFSPLRPDDIGSEKGKDADLLSAYDIAGKYFDALVKKSFFCCMLETEPYDEDQKEYYVLHGLMHDLAQFVSQGECARVDNGDFSSVVMPTIRHLSIAQCSDSGTIGSNLRSIIKFAFLRTFIIQIDFCPDQEVQSLLGDVLGSLKHLRLLYLDVPSLFHTLERVSSLTQLRYLFLFSCDESQLRKVFRFCRLQVFKLKHFTTKEENCSDIYNLHYSLRCLHIPDNMSSKIHQIGRLTLLQELHCFDAVDKDGQSLGDLGSIRNLFQLSLRNLQNVSNSKEAIEINLKDKLHMEFLSLSWNMYAKDRVNQNAQVIDNLEPNKELQRLHIHGYNGVNLPFWIENSSLNHLVSLHLQHCMNWKSLPSLQEISSLKHLKLEGLLKLEYIGTALQQQFAINAVEDTWLPPFLSTLIVRWCPNLKELPAIPCTLELFVIEDVRLAVLPRIVQMHAGEKEPTTAKSQLSVLHIESCAYLTSLEDGLLEQQEQLLLLTTLVIRHCERLCHLPNKGLAELHHLNSLEIVACPILRDVKTKDNMLPASLKNLDVNPCGHIEASILMSLQNLTALRRLTLLNCTNIEKLPSVEVFRTLKNLIDVSIARCKNMFSLGGLGAVASLRVLSILRCDKLIVSESPHDGCSFKLQKLRIDRQALLSVEPLRRLRYTKDLEIGDDYEMVSLPEEWLLQNAASLHSIEIGAAESLRSLPSEMVKLGSLQSLHIETAPLIQSLPQLPVSLSKLEIWGCDPMFLKCYERDVGEDWEKIAHIASVDIKAYSEGTYYGDDQRQDFINSNRQFVVID
ncbi:unnamed protein product [Urochloa decumbens]|uniref:NB-ARC domain-containing protein n=1 Tax=Urochloa decumbens TaxID=240449 RepID=A0ABC8WAW0_9POAL